MGLNIGIGAIEQGLGPLNGQGLSDINKFAAAIIAAARIALGIFIGQDRALRLKHGARDNIFRGDQLNLGLLTLQLMRDTGEQLRVGVLDRSAEKGVQGTSGLMGLNSHGWPFSQQDELQTPQLGLTVPLFTVPWGLFNAWLQNLAWNGVNVGAIHRMWRARPSL